MFPQGGSGRGSQLIKDAEIDYTVHWERKHLRRLYHYYRDARYFEEAYPLIKTILQSQPRLLAEMNISIISALAGLLQIPCTFHRASEFSVDITSPERKPLLRLLGAVGGTVYCADEWERTYLNVSSFKHCSRKAGCLVPPLRDDFSKKVSEYNTPLNISIVDMFFMYGAMTVNSFLVECIKTCPPEADLFLTENNVPNVLFNFTANNRTAALTLF